MGDHVCRIAGYRTLIVPMKAEESVNPSGISAGDFLEISDLLMSDENALRFRWEGRMSSEQFIGPNTRIRVRPRLTAARWPGNIDAAARVSGMLTDNAVVHAKPLAGNVIAICLMCPQDSDVLIIEVTDGLADFPGFDELSTRREARGKPCGLWWVHHYRASVAWRINYDDVGQPVGKTVQVVMPKDWGQ
ncbi:hypothetical protein [Streptomyces sp. NPDC005799]|uniref:hypothetical protein n=1 Tax=Streptomyces sp. NPDC005799 TaxID=3154678 RepID=UPI003400FBC5